MATALDHRSQQQPMNAMGYENVRYSSSPQFTNPWATAGPQSYPYPQQYHTNPAVDHQQAARPLYPQTSQPTQQLDSFTQSRSYQPDYVSAAPPNSSYSGAAAAAYRYSPEQYSTAKSYANFDNAPRRPSFPPPLAGRDTFNEALEASRGIVPMSQDYTPRNIYGPRNGSQDSYGFPATASPHSSISSASSYPYYGSYNGSVDGSVAGSSITDYSSTSEDPVTRTLPAPGQMMSGLPPEPSTMMTQFNSKLPPSAQKKHKCKICDKRFTRPSSLQTHMYSHTGEKPFACDFEGCGRHFSVVSNLRRHKKCHKSGSDHASPDEE